MLLSAGSDNALQIETYKNKLYMVMISIHYIYIHVKNFVYASSVFIFYLRNNLPVHTMKR